jgi:predicted DNA-binding transcriptional regulator YafY
VRVNLEAMRRWALQYGPHVRVLSPESLVNDIRHDIALTAGKYEGSNG